MNRYECCQCGIIIEKYGPPPKPNANESKGCPCTEKGIHDWSYSPRDEEDNEKYWEGYEPES